ncbi:hypothetical protein M408DRAFT_245860 [Serendipita vermifera MAFF 305830]|uniref:Uncharacterized protein n=1 Tax=Serendipita vermifera MAFF 305830 TaxID=933852 RepID=A0A0C3AVP9_SERVB|nr:hypothetical protein M408DRAFT_245860 [Serendipita vermifera MAFF 305830]
MSTEFKRIKPVSGMATTPRQTPIHCQHTLYPLPSSTLWTFFGLSSSSLIPRALTRLLITIYIHFRARNARTTHMATLQDGPTTTTPGISRQASSVHISMDQIESTHARENPAENLQSLLANFRACGSPGSTSSHMKPVPTEERLRELAQDYVLPKGVGLILDAEIQLATATAIVHSSLHLSLVSCKSPLTTGYGHVFGIQPLPSSTCSSPSSAF